MLTLQNLEQTEKNTHIVIVGSGNSIKSDKKFILSFLEKESAKTIGVNCMTSLCIPTYHLWTNKQRYRDLGSCINEKSKFLFGCGLTKTLIRKHYGGAYYIIHYSNVLNKAIKEKIGYADGRIYGHFRTAGVLAIMVAHIMGSSRISIVGMDGFTLHRQKDLKKGRHSQHCYGKGFTDDATWEECIEKDAIVNKELHDLSAYGVDFKIITPTVFDDFYEK